MNVKTSDKALAYLTLISGLTISAVAVWYSVAGLVSIFAAAAVPIIIMGVALEGSKLVATVWLKWNWHRAPRAIKSYLCVAVAILMLITSMGIFGYLSKAHLDQAVPTGDIADKVALIDEKIKTEKDNIDAARRNLSQLDAAVNETMGRSTSEQGAARAVAIRKSQAKDRASLQKDIETSQSKISKLQEERAPIAKDLRAVEAEVGPIKYIAKLVYGDNPDANVLDKAVTWVIIIIVAVFDPLAVILLLASQYSFQWIRRETESQEVVVDNIDVDLEVKPQPVEIPLEETTPVDIKEETKPIDTSWAFFPEKEVEEFTEDDYDELNAASELTVDPKEEQEFIDNATDDEKVAMRAWKHDHPDSSVKLQRKFYDKGLISKLPWENYLKPKADFTDAEAAAEALKWAKEQMDLERPGDYLSETDLKKKDSDLDGNGERDTSNQVQGNLDGYVQNSEQGSNTIWQRIKSKKGNE